MGELYLHFTTFALLTCQTDPAVTFTQPYSSARHGSRLAKNEKLQYLGLYLLLTHKAESRKVRFRKRKFLSTQLDVLSN